MYIHDDILGMYIHDYGKAHVLFIDSVELPAEGSRKRDLERGHCHVNEFATDNLCTGRA